jgi:hypothetical protein
MRKCSSSYSTVSLSLALLRLVCKRGRGDRLFWNGKDDLGDLVFPLDCSFVEVVIGDMNNEFSTRGVAKVE